MVRDYRLDRVGDLCRGLDLVRQQVVVHDFLGLPHVTPFGDCYSGHLGRQPNAGDGPNAANPAACADVCYSREGCTGYKFRHSDGACFPLQVSKADFSAGLARAEGWSSAVKCSAARSKDCPTKHLFARIK